MSLIWFPFPVSNRSPRSDALTSKSVPFVSAKRFVSRENATLALR